MNKFDEIQLPSNRVFGLLFSSIFLLAAFYFYDETIGFIEYILLIISLTILLVVIFKAELLSPFNKIWMKMGFLIGRVISPLVLGLIYFLMITPVAFFMRISGRDELRLNKLKLKTHWKERESSPGTDVDSFKNQF